MELNSGCHHDLQFQLIINTNFTRVSRKKGFSQTCFRYIAARTLDSAVAGDSHPTKYPKSTCINVLCCTSNMKRHYIFQDTFVIVTNETEDLYIHNPNMLNVLQKKNIPIFPARITCIFHKLLNYPIQNVHI